MMPYSIRQFGTLVLTEYKESGQSDNLGTGAALTSWQQLPNGTFFDNYYGVERRPQGIRPLTKEGVLFGETAESIESQIDAIRAYIGVRDRLTVQFRSGVLRWQWAVLKEVNTAAELGRALTVPIQLTFETAAQHWYEIVQGIGWIVGDLSMHLGDGTGELGQQSYTYVLNSAGTMTFTLPHAGNIPATNIKATITAGTVGILALVIKNVTSSDLLSANWQVNWDVGSEDGITPGKHLVIDCGASNITLDGENSFAPFTATHKAQWLRLEKGADNEIQVTITGNANLDGTITFEWYDHYA